MDPAVRSIRIASTLSERFREIMNGPLLPAGVSDLELRIGEAQQIYPEVWTHLDEARAALAARGVDTKTYDMTRALEPKGALGVSRVDVTGYSSSATTALLGIEDQTVKSAQFNIEGHRRQGIAIRALMDAMPEVDWKALERAEAAEIAAAGSLGPVSPKSALRWLVIGGGGIAVVYALWYFVIREKPIDHETYEREHQAALAKQADAARAAADEQPCNNPRVRELVTTNGWLKPPPEPPEATRAHYAEACQAQIAALTQALDATPCDPAKQKQLRNAIRDKTGSVEYATQTVTRYRDQCAGSAATVAP